MAAFVSSLSAWIAEFGAFVSVLTDGTVRGADLVGENVSALTFVPDRVVRHLDMHHGGIRRYGGTCSAVRLTAALAECQSTCKRKDLRGYTYVEMIEHKIFGVSAPSLDAFVAANTVAEEVAA